MNAALSSLLALGFAQTGPLDGDPRLDVPVAVRAEGVSVADLLGRVSTASHIELSADASARDEKIVLFGPSRPLKAVLRDVAALFGAEWRRVEKDGRVRFVLGKKPSTLRREERLETHILRQWQGQVDAQLRALGEGRTRLLGREPGDPIREFLRDPKSRRANQLFARLTSAQRAKFFDEGRLRFPYSELPGDVQRFVYDLAPPSDVPWTSAQIGSARGMVRMRQVPHDLEFQLDERGIGRAQLRFSPGQFAFAVLSATPPKLPRRGSPYVDEPKWEGNLPGTAEVRQAEGATWVDKLKALSTVTRRPVLADFHRLAVRPYPPSIPPVTDPASALDALAAVDGSLWWAEDRSLFFRKADWYERRRYEPPESWLKSVTDALAKRREWPTHGDVLRLRELTFRQQVGVAALGRELGGDVAYASEWYRERLAGLPRLLALYDSPTWRAKPMIAHEYESVAESNRATESATLRYSPTIRHSLWAFLLEQRKEMEAEPVEGFYTYMQAFPAESARERAYRFVPIRIQWRLARGGTNGDFEIALPLSLPDARPDPLQVEIVAG